MAWHSDAVHAGTMSARVDLELFVWSHLFPRWILLKEMGPTYDSSLLLHTQVKATRWKGPPPLDCVPTALGAERASTLAGDDSAARQHPFEGRLHRRPAIGRQPAVGGKRRASLGHANDGGSPGVAGVAMSKRRRRRCGAGDCRRQRVSPTRTSTTEKKMRTAATTRRARRSRPPGARRCRSSGPLGCRGGSRHWKSRSARSRSDRRDGSRAVRLRRWAGRRVLRSTRRRRRSAPARARHRVA